MANYPIKVLVDEQGQEFIPISSTNALLDPTGQNLDAILASKLETGNIVAGSGIVLNKDTVNHTVEINCNLPGASVIDNLTTAVAGQGSLDAHQGYVLNTTKINISDIVNNVTSTDTNKPLSAYQGYLLSNRIPSKVSDLTNDAGYTSNTDLLNLIYPVGSIYMSVNNISPAILFGGSWEQLKDRFLLGAGDVYTAGNTGGDWNHTHSLDTDSAIAAIQLNNDGTIWYGEKNTGVNSTKDYTMVTNGTGKRQSNSSLYGAKLLGDTSSAQVIPPYYAVYMWKRTA